MISELFEFIDGHRMAAIIVVVLFAIAGAGAVYVYSAMSSGPAAAPASGTPLPTTTPGPTATETPTGIPSTPTGIPSPSPEATPIPSPTPVPSPTVTPDLAIERSIAPLDQYAPNHMVWVEKSTTTGLLSVDLANSDTGGQYAYVSDTFTARLTFADFSDKPVDRIRIHASCINGTGTNHVLYEGDRIDYVLLRPGDKISRTVGFQVPPGAPGGVYKFRIDISADLQGNGTWRDFGCSYESGLNVLEAPQ